MAFPMVDRRLMPRLKWGVAAVALAGLTVSVVAQTPLRVRTSEGREVILRPDGTWAYADDGTAAPRSGSGQQSGTSRPEPPASRRDSDASATAIGQAATTLPSAPQPPSASQPASAVQPPQSSGHAGLPAVRRPSDATAQLSTRRGNFRFWYNPQKWRPTPEHADGRIQLQLIGFEAYIVVIPEGTPVPIPQLKTLALENASKSGPDARIVSEQRRALAGREILAMQIKVTVNKSPVVFNGYYYGDPQGSIQVVGYAAERDLPRVRTEILEALDGLDLNR